MHEVWEPEREGKGAEVAREDSEGEAEGAGARAGVSEAERDEEGEVGEEPSTIRGKGGGCDRGNEK